MTSHLDLNVVIHQCLKLKYKKVQSLVCIHQRKHKVQYAARKTFADKQVKAQFG